MRLALTLICVGCAVVVATLSVPAATRADDSLALGCKNYAYAGAQDSKVRYGVRASIRTISNPGVQQGHVAAWLGVGGPGRGPNGTTEWLQAGYAAMNGGWAQIYYEVTTPEAPTRYHTVKASLAPGEQHELAVVETKRDTWTVFLDRQPVSPPILLRGSHGRFSPQVVGETWNAGTSVCNHYGYAFTKIRMAKKVGGSWVLPKAGYVFRDNENQAVKTSNDSFTARSTSSLHAPSPKGPPLLGPLASELAGRPFTAACVEQDTPVRENPRGHLLFSRRLCEILLGYALAQPHAPTPDGRAGTVVASAALGFLRGVGQVAGVDPAHLDCRTVAWIFKALHTLGATPRQALNFRAALIAKLGPLPDCSPG